jgi:hypothetical protein
MMGIYSVSGVQLAVTSDMTTAFQSTGWAEGTLATNPTITAGTDYFIALQANFTGTLLQVASQQASNTVPSLLSGTQYLTLSNSSFSSLPSSFTPGSASANKNMLIMYAR